MFLTCADIKEGVDKLSGGEVTGVFKKYLREVENICNIVDALLWDSNFNETQILQTQCGNICKLNYPASEA